ncbi:MAG: hypothetical protein JXX28_16295 [Deltaproteobacteria bacterium]|nr:hypothetical protein [Deltaproteobacteria bacterium]
MRSLPLVLVALTAGCNEYGVITDLREQNIEQRYEITGARSDILFYADTSSSMESELYRMGRTVEEFVSRLEGAAEDWQIITVTGPDGCGTVGVLNPQTPDWKTLFAEGITTKPADDDVDEWGLFNVRQAIMKSAPGLCNDGFIRPEATLHVIFLSDEKDTSPGYEMGGDYWRDYVDPIRYVKDSEAQVKLSGIIGPTPNGCTGADPGYGYAEAVQFTHGEQISICDDWTTQVEILADASVSQDFFPLQHQPIEGTLQVLLNQEILDSGWAQEGELTEGTLGVRFSDPVPGAWDEVFLNYRAIVEVEVDEEGNVVVSEGE